jgi:purine-nucleoside phosphorylase
VDDYDRAREAADAIGARIGAAPTLAVVLGSGLGDFASAPERAVAMPYEALPHWPASRVAGHEGRLVVGGVSGKQVAVLSGRCHAYEGHSLAAVTFPVRVLGLMGVKTLILTNAAGGINTNFSPAELMVIDDHLNLMGGSPLAGANDERFGARFPDMSEVYSSRLRRIADDTGLAIGIGLMHGVYAGLLGPSYETPAEIRYLRTIGADAVGMSTVPEAIAARHMGIEVLAISCITNMAAGVRPQPLVHDDVVEAGRRAREPFTRLLEGIIGRL